MFFMLLNYVKKTTKNTDSLKGKIIQTSFTTSTCTCICTCEYTCTYTHTCTSLPVRCSEFYFLHVHVHCKYDTVFLYLPKFYYIVICRII